MVLVTPLLTLGFDNWRVAKFTVPFSVVHCILFFLSFFYPVCHTDIKMVAELIWRLFKLLFDWHSQV